MEFEKDIERFLTERIRRKGGYCIKLNPAGNTGLPDREVLWNGKVWFIELKRSGGRLSPKQKIWANRLQDQGFEWRCIRSKKEVELFVKEMEETQ